MSIVWGIFVSGVIDDLNEFLCEMVLMELCMQFIMVDELWKLLLVLLLVHFGDVWVDYLVSWIEIVLFDGVDRFVLVLSMFTVWVVVVLEVVVCIVEC